MKHQFGGIWTRKKLEVLKKYLEAYIKIFETNESAKKLQRFYVDGFAGTGSIYNENKDVIQPEQQSFSDFDDFEEFSQDFIPGSAKLALDLDPGFHKYFFIEKKPEHVKMLEKTAREYPEKCVQILQDDCNRWLQKWCLAEKWGNKRAVVFLDPYGMQVAWKTIEVIARTNAIDLWLLFPLGQAVNRLLPSGKKPPEHWASSLDKCLGSRDWRTEFYKKSIEPNLFDFIEEKHKKCVSVEDVGYFFVKRLETVFSRVAPEPMFLYNSSNCPIFLLCFAAGNPKGAPTAVKIAQDIIRKEFADGWK